MKKQRDAFAMREMLVLIPVLALMGTGLLASLNDAQDKLKAAACLNNMRQWGLGFALYANDWNDSLPGEGSSQIDAVFNQGAWYNVIPPYLHQARLVDLYNAGKPPTPFTKGIWTCPSATNTSVTSTNLTAATPYFMYAMNNRMDPNGTPRFKYSQMTSPSNTIIFCDGEEDSFSGTNGKYCPARHFGGANLTMADGHAEWVAHDDFCRECPANGALESDASAFGGDWDKARKYHWFPYRNAPT